MINVGGESRTSPAKALLPPPTAENALSFISRGWREVRDSAGADLKLMRARANTFKDLATSIDRELENFLGTASGKSKAAAPSELEFVRRLQPKLTELRRAYSSPEKVLERWTPRARISIDLSSIRDAFVSEVEEGRGRVRRRVWTVKKGEEEERGWGEDWEPIRKLKTGWRELERRRNSSEIFEGFRNSEFVDKVKLSLKSLYREPQDSKEVPPLDVPELLAYFVKQSGPFFDQIGVKRDQELVYPSKLTFSSPEEQEAYIRDWLEERIGFKADFKISFYPGKFHKERRSIIPAGDTSQFISSKDADIAILEEPEHLNWYHHGKRWTDKFNHVVGVVHTNYLEYIKREKNGAIQAFMVKHINNWVARAYCDKILRLSGATQDLPRSVICNVHGVNPKFLKVGEKMAADKELGQQAFSKGAYFLGKMVWAKGYRELIDLLATHKNDLADFKLDVYGNGEDSLEVQSTAKKLELNLNFLKGRDHADDSLHGYKVFINPSVSDVLCTATAEALAMGKFVICADHPSNEFFRAFPNCLTYKTSEDFVMRVKEAMASDPVPLTPEERYNLSWEAATQRFMAFSDLDRVLGSNNEDTMEGNKSNKTIKKSISMPNLTQTVDGALAFAHHCLTGNEVLRLCTGALPGTREYDQQHCRDLHLPPAQIDQTITGTNSCDTFAFTDQSPTVLNFLPASHMPYLYHGLID
ncbi:hypothetical protein QJS04_geneDACA008605 [Acorus gramineus]|uniref:Digalactosyldiacylglycerol synthase 1, chloroplastic n=1 Tax=Acorus gramineus TaxID=55184 RepID=A0AAV9AG17_ACOGR|nr:hypothetical protein QJS04_geneDACA008605 [Acorus gramineus]